MTMDDEKNATENPMIDTADAGLRMDGWVNHLTGGGREARTQYEFEKTIRTPDQFLDDLYYGDPYAARVCDCVPEEAMRRGFTFKLDFGKDLGARGLNSQTNAKGGDEQKATARLHQFFDAHHGPAKTREAWTWARVWGGGFLLVGVNDGQPVTEKLDLKAAKEFLYVASCDKTELQPLEWYEDPEQPNYGEPRMYQLTRQAGVTVDSRQIHATRVIRFDGSMTTRRRRLQNNSWSESVLLRVHNALKMFNGAYAAISSLLQEASVRSIGMKDLAKMMMADGGSLLKKRLATMDAMTSVFRATLYDKDLETVERTEVGALSGLAEMLRMYMLFLAGAFHIPVTVLMGQAPAGLNATGDSDLRLFYDRIASDREIFLKPRLIRLATIICACDNGPTGGVVPRIDVEFPSMYATTPAEDADIRQKTAQADQIYLQNGVVTPEEIATSRFTSRGWSPTTTIDLDARGPVGSPTGVEEPKAPGEGKDGESGDVTKDAASEPQYASLSPKQMGAAMDIVQRVASRAISRPTGIAMLTSALPLTAQQAEQIMGDTGTSHFTSPEPKLLQEHEDIKTRFAKLQRSADSRSRLIKRIIAHNKAGKLWTGFGGGEEHDDETDDDVREGEQGEGQMRAMPEGPPYTKPMNLQVTNDSWIETAGRFDAGTGVCIVLPLPPDAIPGVTDPHCTLAYLGDLSSFSPEQLDAVRRVVSKWASQQAPIAGVFSGAGFFDRPDGNRTMVAFPSCPDLASAREALLRALDRGADIRQASEHGYIPHVTLGRIGPNESDANVPKPSDRSITFGTVAVWAGPERFVEYLGGKQS